MDVGNTFEEQVGGNFVEQYFGTSTTLTYGETLEEATDIFAVEEGASLLEELGEAGAALLAAL